MEVSLHPSSRAYPTGSSELAPSQQGVGALPTEQLRKLKYNHPALDELALMAEQRHGVPRGVLLAVKNAGEFSNSWQESPAGAKGVMQFIDSTRKAYPHDPLDPMQSIDAGARYVADLIRQYNGNVWAALAHYNGGHVQARAILEGRAPPSKETREYLKRIEAFLDGA